MSNNITKAGFRPSATAASASPEDLTPYVVNPNGDGTYLTISEAIDAIVADGANTNDQLPALILLSSDTHSIGSQLALPRNIRISGPTDTGFGYQQSSRRSAIVDGTFLIDVESEVTDGIYMLSDLELTTSTNESLITISGTNSNPQMYLDGVTLDYNGDTTATAFEATNTTFAAYYFYECNIQAASTMATIYVPNSGQSVLVRNSYVQGSTDAIEAGAAASVLASRVQGIVKGGPSGAGHEIKFSEITSTSGDALIQIGGAAETVITSCDLSHPLAVFSGTAATATQVYEGQNNYVQSQDYLNAIRDNISGEFPDKYKLIGSKLDLPNPSGGVITLADNTTYFFAGDIDLTGDRLVAGEDTVITGGSSENSTILSTGLTGDALITSQYSLPMRFISLSASIAIDLDGSGISPTPVIDWFGVNFLNCPTMGTIKDYGNVIFSDCAILNSDELTYDGEIGTVAWNNSLFVGSGAAKSVHILSSTLDITRRWRSVYSAGVAPGSSTLIEVQDASNSFANNESFILDTVNFSGGGAYLSGTSNDDNQTLITNTVGVPNSANIAQYFMTNNTGSTGQAPQGTFFKVSGSTTPGEYVEKFTVSNNRATYVGALTAFFEVVAMMSIVGSNNNVIATRVAKNGVTIEASQTRSTLNSSGRSENSSCQAVTQLVDGDYVEIWVANETSGNSITVEDLSVIVKRA